MYWVRWCKQGKMITQDPTCLTLEWPCGRIRSENVKANRVWSRWIKQNLKNRSLHWKPNFAVILPDVRQDFNVNWCLLSFNWFYNYNLVCAFDELTPNINSAIILFCVLTIQISWIYTVCCFFVQNHIGASTVYFFVS